VSLKLQPTSTEGWIGSAESGLTAPWKEDQNESDSIIVVAVIFYI